MTTHAGAVENPKLRRALTTPLLALYGLGVTVGAGIYVLVGATAHVAGAHASFSFLLAAVVVSLTALSYAELATRYPVSAGEAAYVEAGFNAKWLAVVVGLAVASSGMVSAAAVAMGAGSYLHGLLGLPEGILTIVVVVLMGLIAMWGIAQSVIVASIITVIEILGLLFVIAWGLWLADPQGVTPKEMIPSMDADIWSGIFAASLLAFFAFVGFEDMANVAEEVKEPTKTIPRAIFWTLVVATLLYIGTSATVLMVVPLETLSTSAAPLLLVFADASPVVKQGFGMVAVVATVNGVLIQTIMASRVLYGLADRGELPSVLARVSPRTNTPVVATVVVMCLILLLTQTLPIAVLAERTSQIVLFVFILVNVSLIRLKSKPASQKQHYNVSFLVPVFGTITSILLFAAGFL